MERCFCQRSSRSHRAALQREERIAAGYRQALSSDVTAADVAIDLMQAIEEAAVVIAVDTVK